MNRAVVVLAAVLLATPAAASTVVICDAAHPAVAGKVSAVHTSAHTPDYEGRSDAIVEPDLSSVREVPVRYWHCTPQAEVREMTPAQKATLDQWEADQQKAARETAESARYDDEIVIKAVALVTLDELNRLRAAVCQLHPVPAQVCQQLQPITEAQLRTAIRARVQALAQQNGVASGGGGGSARGSGSR